MGETVSEKTEQAPPREPDAVAVPLCRDHYDCEACSAYTDFLYARIDAVTLERDQLKRQRDALAKAATSLADWLVGASRPVNETLSVPGTITARDCEEPLTALRTIVAQFSEGK